MEATSYYDTRPLKQTLERLVDFDRINDGPMRFSVGAVNMRTGNFIYFDKTTHRIGPKHIMASGALPPGFPAVEIDGEHYWDGGLVSNTPLQWVVEAGPRQDTLAFQVDLWSARGELPRDWREVATGRRKSSIPAAPARAPTSSSSMQRCANAVAQLLAGCPELADAGGGTIAAADGDTRSTTSST